MAQEIKNADFKSVLGRGLSIWLLGGIIFWLVELLTILIGLPFSWDYKFLHDGMPVIEVIMLTIIPDEISTAFLCYISAGFIGGIASSSAAFLLFRGKDEAKTNALLIAVCLLTGFFMFAGLWMNIKYLPILLSFKALSGNVLFLLVCISLAYMCFKIFITKSPDSAARLFITLAFTANLMMLGEILLLKSFKFRLLSPRGIASGVILTVVCTTLFFISRRILDMRFFAKLNIYSLRKWVFSAAAVLVLCSGLIVITKNYSAGNLKETSPDKPNIVLIVMDTTRSDHLSSYGYERDTTPSLKRIAREGVLFSNVISPSAWTLPSHASIFTGLFPLEHGAGHISSYLPEEIETMAEILKEQGYRTLAYSNNPWVSFFSGLQKGFDDFYEGWKRKVNRYVYETVRNELLKFAKRNDPAWTVKDHGAAKTNRYVSGWIEKNLNSPFMVFINYMEPHLPFEPPPPYDTLFLPETISQEEAKSVSPSTHDVERFIIKKQRGDKELSAINALYDGEIRYLDGKIGELYEELKRLNVLDNTLLIITSDHGENLGDHGIVGHAFGVFNTLLDVHLIIRYPGHIKEGVVIDNTIQTTDIFYTVMEAAGIERNPSRLGLSKSLIRRLSDNSYSEIMLAEHDKPKNVLRWAKKQKINADHIDKSQVSIISGPYKYIQTSKGENELYDLSKDPGELTDISSEHPETVSALKNKLTALIRNARPITGSGEGPQIDDETKEKLRGLGYIN